MNKSSGHNNIGAVVEWSPNGALSYEPLSKRTQSGATISDLGLSPNGHTTMLAVSRRTVFVKPTHVPNAGNAEIRQILLMKLGDLFPVAPSELAYDLWLTGKVSAEGRLAVVCGIRTDTLKALNTQASDAGIRSSRVVPAGLGSALLARSLGQKDCTVIEQTSEGLAIDIVVDGELRWSRVVPLGPGIDIEAEIERTHGMAGVPQTTVVAAGGMDYAGTAIRSDHTTLEMLASTQAQSIAIHLELPEEVALRDARKKGRRLRQALYIAVVACALWAKLGYDMAGAASARARVEAAWQSQLNSARTAQSKAEAARTAAMQEDTVLTRAFQPAQKFSEILGILGNYTPPNAWLGGVTVERSRPLVVRGTAMNSEAVAALLQKLSSDNRFRDVKLVVENDAMIGTTPVVQFSLSMHVVGNLPLVDSDKDKRRQ